MENEYFLHYRSRSDLKNNVNVQFDDPYSIRSSRTSIERTIIECPYFGDDEDILQALAIVENKIVGILYYFPLIIKAKNELFKASCGSFLFVHPLYRKHATIGIELHESLYSRYNVFIAGGLTNSAVRMHKFYKGKEFVIPRYLMLVKSKPVIEARLKIRGILLYLISSIMNLLLLLQRFGIWIITKVELSNFTVEEVKDIPEEIDGIIAAQEYKFQELHDKKWFEWAVNNKFYDEDNFKKHFFIVKNKTKSIIAFFMTTERFYDKVSIYENVNVGSVMDWETSDHNILSEQKLAILALRSFGKNIDVIEFATTNMQTTKFFSKIGLVRKGQRNMMIKIVPRKIPEIFDGYDNIENWRIRPAVGDSIMY